MRLRITRREGCYMEMELGGEDHTFLNILQSSLLEDPSVEMAGYSRPHPLMDRSKLFINLKEGEDHEEAIKRAGENAKAKLDEFLAKFERSLADLEEQNIQSQ